MMPPQISGSPDEVIPTRNLLILSTYPDDIPVLSMEEATPADPTVVPTPVPTPIPEPSVAVEADQATKRQVQPQSMGRGYVEAHFSTSVNSPEMMIEDKQRYMASGLFNVHIIHEYAG
ncbi:MAG: hypothetical protein LUQ07_03330 [Methanospirillum sp.]|nr:hypothetical protein [Methanospirillum sp.]